MLGGELPDDIAASARSAKPDLEALTLLPPFRGAPVRRAARARLGLGAERSRGLRLGAAADGSIAGEPDELDLAPLYRLLRDHVAELNIEGAATMGERLWLLHRGAAQEGDNASPSWRSTATHSLRDDRRFDAEELATTAAMTSASSTA